MSRTSRTRGQHSSYLASPLQPPMTLVKFIGIIRVRNKTTFNRWALYCQFSVTEGCGYDTKAHKNLWVHVVTPLAHQTVEYSSMLVYNGFFTYMLSKSYWIFCEYWLSSVMCNATSFLGSFLHATFLNTGFSASYSVYLYCFVHFVTKYVCYTQLS